MTQASLFDAPARARRTDPDTSRAAAASIPGTVYDRVFSVFLSGSDFTDDELCDVVDGYPPTIKSARSRLTHAGWLVDSGMRRPSNRGHEMVAWVLRSGHRPVLEVRTDLL